MGLYNFRPLTKPWKNSPIIKTESKKIVIAKFVIERSKSHTNPGKTETS
jgi:hypothetical protein